MLIAVLAISSLAHADGPHFPKLTGRVVDAANILSVATRSRIDALSADHEHWTGEQVVVVTIKSLQGYSIEDFGYQLGRYWGIGQALRNNGVLLIVAPHERKVRIEVGYGLEATLTDAQSRLIIEQSILPAFRRGDFDSGVLDGFDAILRVLGGNPLAVETAAPPQYPHLIKGAPWQGLVGLLIWALFFFGGFGFFFVMWFRHRNDPPDYASYRGGSSSGWSSGGSSGGSSSSGGFSGGGGSFGGGGASGSW
jgi:uncharacterized protein